MTTRVVATSSADLKRTETGREPAGRETQRVEPHPALAKQRSVGNSAVGRVVDRLVQRSASGSGAAVDARAASADALVRRTLAGGGKSLEGPLRSSLEQELGHDLGRVRVHTDADAAEAARAVNARAFTVGQDVVFAHGAFEPSLLAHEIVHTLQQPARRPDGEAVRVEPTSTSLEQAAERVSPRGSTGRPSLQRRPAPGGAELEPSFTIFVADDARKTDVSFARDQARMDVAAIRKARRLTPDDRQLVRAKLRFFEGDAWKAYGAIMRPALIEVTQAEIELEGDVPAGGPTAKLDVPTDRLKFLPGQPT